MTGASETWLMSGSTGIEKPRSRSKRGAAPCMSGREKCDVPAASQ